MTVRDSRFSAITFYVFFAIAWSTPAFAYVDPGASNAVFQFVAPVGAVATTVLLFMRRWVAGIWHTLMSSVKKKRG